MRGLEAGNGGGCRVAIVSFEGQKHLGALGGILIIFDNEHAVFPIAGQRRGRDLVGFYIFRPFDRQADSKFGAFVRTEACSMYVTVMKLDKAFCQGKPKTQPAAASVQTLLGLTKDIEDA